MPTPAERIVIVKNLSQIASLTGLIRATIKEASPTVEAFVNCVIDNLFDFDTLRANVISKVEEYLNSVEAKSEGMEAFVELVREIIDVE